MVKPFPAERISERTVEQLVDTPVFLRSRNKLWMLLKAFRKRATSEHTVEQIAGVPVPQIQDPGRPIPPMTLYFQ